MGGRHLHEHRGLRLRSWPNKQRGGDSLAPLAAPGGAVGKAARKPDLRQTWPCLELFEKPENGQEIAPNHTKMALCKAADI